MELKDYIKKRGEDNLAKDLGVSVDTILTEVEQLSAVESCDRYSDHNTLLIVWPPHDNSMACDALSAFKGDKLNLYFLIIENKFSKHGYHSKRTTKNGEILVKLL